MPTAGNPTIKYLIVYPNLPFSVTVSMDSALGYALMVGSGTNFLNESFYVYTHVTRGVFWHSVGY